MTGTRLGRAAGAVARRPVLVLALAGVLTLVAGLLALRLQPSAGADTLASKGSAEYKATQEYHRDFGDDSVVILVREKVTDLVLTADLGRLIRLEGCLGGNVPKGAKPYGKPGEPCSQLAKLKPVEVVYGPGTFLLESTNQIQDQLRGLLQDANVKQQRAATAAAQLAKAHGASPAQQRRVAQEAAQLAQQQSFAQLARLALQTGIQGLPSLGSKPFISQVVFDPARGSDVPKARFAYLFPNRDSSLIQVRLKPGLSQTTKDKAIRLIKAAIHGVHDPKTGKELFKLSYGGTYTVSGVPVVVAGLADAITGSIAGLLVAAVLVMAAMLLAVFRTRAALRLLPLAIALSACALTFGLMSLAGASITMAGLAVLPVLIGLGVDYAIQYQSRVDEVGGVERGARLGGPAIATAGLATATGFLVLLLSPIPMVRGFGLLLVLGIALALTLALTVGSAAMTLAARRPPRPPGRPSRVLEASWHGAASLVRGAPGAGAVRRGALAALRMSARRPGRVLAVGLALALAGWVADTQTKVVSDVTKLVPQDLSALRDLRTLQDATNSSGEIDIVVRAKDLTQPRVIRWMTGYEAGLLKTFGYKETRGCGPATLCPALSLPALFLKPQDSASSKQIRALLDGIPPYFSQAAITHDRRTATLAFGIRLMPLERQQQVIDVMRDRLHPPPGVSATLAGLPVLAAAANAKLSSPWRRLGTLVAGLLAVALVLWLVFRDVARALVPLVPIALATGWSSLILFATPIPLNPMSAVLGALVIAISTEFSVLLSERFRQERRAGHAVGGALARTYRSTGRAVLASGLTAVAGFGVLVVSDIQMLRDFGFVTVIDLVVSLLGVMLVLPAVLVLAERGALSALRLPRPRLRARAGARV